MLELYLLPTIAGYIAAHIYENFGEKIVKKDKLIVYGYRLHHSLYALLFLALGFIDIKVAFFGIGILIQHTVTDGFRFISKE